MKQHFLILAIALLLVLGCGRAVPKGAQVNEHGQEEPAQAEPGHEEPGHSEDIVLSADAAKIAGIRVEEARRLMMQSELKVPGTVTSTSQGRAVVTPPTEGQILRLFVRVGETVRAGQPIASLRSAGLAQASAQVTEAQGALLAAHASAREAKAQIDLAEARHRSAIQLVTRQLAFAKTGAFSQPALQAAQKDSDDAEADLERGKQDQAVHEAQLERAERLYKQELISRTELEQARLEVATDKIRQRNAERRITLARATFERERRIADQGLANSREIQAAEAEVRASNLEVRQATIRWNSATAHIESARKGVEAAQTSYRAQAGTGKASGGNLTVSAPIGGVIVDLHATLGQAVERTTEICEIENLKSVWVNAAVSDKQVGLARVGAAAEVTVSGYPGRNFHGVIQVVGSRLDPKTRTMPVQVLVENRDGALRSGMPATVRLGVGPKAMALAVLRSAIVEDGDLRKLYIAEDGGKYEERVVELGRIEGDFVEIVKGVEPGQLVVVEGVFVLKSEKVKGELKGHEH